VHVVAPLVTAPVPFPISATEPAGHFAQLIDGLAEYFPDRHGAHVEAPVLTAPQFTAASATEPLRWQAVQTPVGDAEYLPDPHGVHVVAPLVTAPVPLPISAIEPAGHIAQLSVDDAEYLPDPQGVHVVAPLVTAPVPLPISATEPAGHATHACGTMPVPLLVLYPATPYVVAAQAVQGGGVVRAQSSQPASTVWELLSLRHDIAPVPADTCCPVMLPPQPAPVCQPLSVPEYFSLDVTVTLSMLMSPCHEVALDPFTPLKRS
jgi:hypothetical protein